MKVWLISLIAVRQKICFNSYVQSVTVMYRQLQLCTDIYTYAYIYLVIEKCENWPLTQAQFSDQLSRSY
jgi:hypothetical protein